jgi:hypothetical protein
MLSAGRSTWGNGIWSVHSCSIQRWRNTDTAWLCLLAKLSAKYLLVFFSACVATGTVQYELEVFDHEKHAG